jgi:hypothetical protein
MIEIVGVKEQLGEDGDRRLVESYNTMLTGATR